MTKIYKLYTSGFTTLTTSKEEFCGSWLQCFKYIINTYSDLMAECNSTSNAIFIDMVISVNTFFTKLPTINGSSVIVVDVDNERWSINEIGEV